MNLTADRLKRFMYYHGLRKEQYEAIRPEMDQLNLKGVCAFAEGGMIIHFVLLVLNIVTGMQSDVNSIFYFLGVLLFLIIRLLSGKLKHLGTMAIDAAAVLCIVLMLLPGVISAVSNTGIGAKSSLFLAFMLIGPLYIYLTGVTYCVTICLIEMLYLVAISALQSGTTLFAMNCVNSLIITMVSVIVGPYAMRIKARGIFHYYEIGRFSQVEEQKKQIEKNYYVISALANPYKSIYYLNLKTRHYVALTADNKDVAALFGDEGDADLALETLYNTRVHPVYVQQLREFCELDTMSERLGEKKFINCDYKNAQGLWRRAVYMAGDRDEQGKLLHVIWGILDINEEKEKDIAQQRVLSNAYVVAEQANRAKTMFLNSMSHDIRTPMNAIVGFANLAASRMDRMEQVGAYLEKIRESSRHLVALINDVLDIGQIERGQMEANEEEFSLPDTIHSVVSVVNTAAASKHLRIYVAAENIRHEQLIGDALRLTQVLLNIAENAVKYTNPNGNIWIAVRELAEAPADSACYEFRIRDDGVGMSPEVLKNLFDSYALEQQLNKRKHGGGLGMTITKNVVDMLGGTIAVESTEGVGTEFTVSLTFRIGAGSEAPGEEPEALQGTRLLVVDASAEYGSTVAAQVALLGIQTENATTAEAAMERITAAVAAGTPFDAYIVDEMLPDMQALALVREIRRCGGKRNPNIIYTAYDWQAQETEAKDAGVSTFAAKPLFPTELRERLLNRRGRPENEPGERIDPVVDFHGNRILLVEDNALNREIAATVLQEVGFEIDIAEDGAEALQLVIDAEEGRYDLILMDIRMPNMDGYEATRRIRALEDWEKADIPIVAMTANAFAEDEALALEAGMDAHVAKPIDVPRLLEVIRKCLEW